MRLHLPHPRQGRPYSNIHTIDGFHRPKTVSATRPSAAIRPKGYYYDARDLVAVETLLLAPLGPEGDRLYRTQSFDLENDVTVEQEPRPAFADAVLIVDGTFLLSGRNWTAGM